MTGNIYLGAQSWTNRNWLGNFCPPNTPVDRYLAEYAKRFHAVEIDSSFYAIFVLADYGKMPASIQLTTDFTYVRWVGNRKDFPDGKSTR